MKPIAIIAFSMLLMLWQPVLAQQTSETGQSTDATSSDSAAGATSTDSSTAAKSADSTASESSDQSQDTGVIGSAGGSAGGQLSFQADLFTGRFAYSVPIQVAPGRQGASPKLALGYNSAGGNGWCGVGWSLDVGYIQRETRKGVPILFANSNVVVITTNFFFNATNYSYATNNFLLARQQYDDDKGFVANIGGSMGSLVRVGPTNQNPVVYRMQVDGSFLTFKYYTKNHSEVVDKSGNLRLLYSFGMQTSDMVSDIRQLLRGA